MKIKSTNRGRASDFCWLLSGILTGFFALALLFADTGLAAAKLGTAGVSTAKAEQITLASHRKTRTRYKRRQKQRRRKARQRQNQRNKATARRAAPAWRSDKSLNGPVQLVLSLPRQRLTVYKAGQKVATSRVSTGRRGYRTPTGVFSIIQKHRRHYSNLYGGAPMPFMQRITWSGVALHAGLLPGYPASHGCIRLPHSFARQLYGYTKLGAHVIVTQSATEPIEISHPALLQPNSLASIAGYNIERWLAGNRVELNSTGLDEQDRGAIGAARSAMEEVTARTVAEAALQMADLEATQERIRAYTARSKLPLRMLITRRSGRERVKDVQRVLAELGYGPGPADGDAGRKTIAAIKRFQEAMELPVTGTVSDALVDALYEAAGKGDVTTGHLYVRQGFRDVLDAPITIKDPNKRLGTHLFTAMGFGKNDTTVRWQAMSLSDRGPREVQSKVWTEQTFIPSGLLSAENALDRIEIPELLRQRISDMLTPGSSLAITDHGISRETGRGTDFVVLTR